MNPRNTASGSLKIQDSAEVYKEAFGSIISVRGRRLSCKNSLGIAPKNEICWVFKFLNIANFVNL